MNLHWKKAAALLLAGVLTAGTLSAFPAAAEDAVPSDTASAPTAAETVPEVSTEEASPEPTEPETDTNGDQIPIDKHTPDFYDALTNNTGGFLFRHLWREYLVDTGYTKRSSDADRLRRNSGCYFILFFNAIL